MSIKKNNTSLVNCQSNFISLLGLPLSEFQYNVYLILINHFNQYEDNTGFNKKEKEFDNEISFNPYEVKGFKFSKDRFRIEKNVEDLLNVHIKKTEKSAIEDKVSYSVLFTSASYNYKEKLISVGINFRYIKHFRDFDCKYHQYYLDEAISIPGKYCKALYLALSVYVYSGNWIVSLSRLNEILCLPKNYRPTQIANRIIKPLQQFLESQKSSFSFSFSPILKNKKITAFKFYNITNNVPVQGNIIENYDSNILIKRVFKEFANFLEKNEELVKHELDKSFCNKIINNIENETITCEYDKEIGILYLNIKSDDKFHFAKRFKKIDNLIFDYKDLFQFILKKYFPKYNHLEYNFKQLKK